MPFAGYKDFEDCKSKNRDKRDPDAYCGSIKHNTEDKAMARDNLQKAMADFEATAPKDRDPAAVLAGIAKLRKALSL